MTAKTVILAAPLVDAMTRSLSETSSVVDAASPSSSVGGSSAGVSPQPVDDGQKCSFTQPQLSVLLEVAPNGVKGLRSSSLEEEADQSPQPSAPKSPHQSFVEPQPMTVVMITSPTEHQSQLVGEADGFNSSLDDEVVGVTADGELLFRRRDGQRNERRAVRPTPRHQQAAAAMRSPPPPPRPTVETQPMPSAEEVHMRYLALRRRDKENDLYGAYVHEELQLLVDAGEARWMGGLHERFEQMLPACLR